MKIMRILLVSICFLLFSNADNVIQAQDSMRMKLEQMRKNAEEMNKSVDSLNSSIDRHMENMRKEREEEQMKRFQEQNQRALDAFLAEQKRQDLKKQKSLVIRGIIFLVLIGFWIVSFLRRRKLDKLKKAEQTGDRD